MTERRLDGSDDLRPSSKFVSESIFRVGELVENDTSGDSFCKLFGYA